MNENKKTLVFLAVAVACLALALFTNPTKRDPSDNTNRMGQALFESFDPRDATGIEIVEIDEENLDAKSIEVAQTPEGVVHPPTRQTGLSCKRGQPSQGCIHHSLRPSDH